MADYVAGNASRIFINPVLGCDSNCSYCYLGSQDLVIGKKTISPKPAAWLIEKLLACEEFVKGRNGTIISIGCYSECWSRSNIEVTKSFIILALKYGNPIQFASKRSVVVSQLGEIIPHISWEGQLSLFVSCSTISLWRIYEKGTARPSDRFKDMEKIKEMGIQVCLYIKPVLKSVTLADVSLFCKVVDQYGCAVIVGDSFSFALPEGPSEKVEAPIPSTGLFVEHIDDKDELLEIFHEKGYTIFNSSVDAVNFWRWGNE